MVRGSGVGAWVRPTTGLCLATGRDAYLAGRAIIRRAAGPRVVMLRALPDPDLVEQRAVNRGFLVVPDPGGDEHGR